MRKREHTLDTNPERSDSAGSRRKTYSHLLVALTLLAALVLPPFAYGTAQKPWISSLLACLAAAAVAFERRCGRLDGVTATRASAGFGLLILGGLFALPFAKVPDAARTAMPIAAAMALLHFAASHVFGDRRRLVAVGSIAVLGGGGVALVGLFRYMDFRDALATGAAADDARALFLSTPFFEHGYVAVSAVAPLLPFALALACSTRSTALRVALAASALLIGSFTIASFSRAAALALAAGVAVCIVTARRAGALRPHDASTTPAPRVRTLAPAVVGAILMAVAAVWVLAPEGLASRFRSLTDPALAVFNFMRVLVWEDSLRLISDHLPFGVGSGNFGFVLGQYHFASRPVGHAHDQWLHTLAETGVLGLCGLVLATVATFREAAARRAAPDQAWLRGGLCGLLATQIVIACFESPFAFAGGALPFACWTAALVASSRSANARSSEPDAKPALGAGAGWLPPVLLACVALLVAAPAVVRYARAGFKADRALHLLFEGDPAAARDLAERAESIAPGIPEVLSIRARAEKRLGNLDASAAALVRHDAILPGLPDHLFDRAAIAIEQGRAGEAIDPLLQALRRAPAESQHELRLTLADALHRAERFEAARLELVELIARSVHIQRPVVLLRLAETLMNLGRERATVTALLLAYEGAVPPNERRYAEQLRASIPRWFEN